MPKLLGGATALAILIVVLLPAGASAKVTCKSPLVKSGSVCVPQTLIGGGVALTVYPSRPDIVAVSYAGRTPIPATCTQISKGTVKPRQLEPRDARGAAYALLTNGRFAGSSNGITVSGRFTGRNRAEVTIGGIYVSGNRNPSDQLGSGCALSRRKVIVTGSPTKAIGSLTLRPKPRGTCTWPYFKAGRLCVGQSLESAQGAIWARRRDGQVWVRLFAPLPVTCSDGASSTYFQILTQRNGKDPTRFGDTQGTLPGVKVTVDGRWTAPTKAQATITVNSDDGKGRTCNGSTVLTVGTPVGTADDFIQK